MAFGAYIGGAQATVIVPDGETRTIGGMTTQIFVLLRRYALVAFFALLTACSAMLIGDGHQGSSSIGSEHRSSTQLADDDALATALRGALASDSLLDSEQLSVSVYGAVATLSGVVGSFEARERAIRIARNVAGISRVNSQLQVNTNH